MTYNRKDYFFHKAKKENYAARSIFKLEEIDHRYRILKSGDQILDLGAAPGSWSQFCSKKIGPKGHILGIDLQKIEITLLNAVFIEGDILKTDIKATARLHHISFPFDVVLSDMAPRTTGIKVTDQSRSLELCQMALQTARSTLKNGGHFVCKLFHSPDFEIFRKDLKNYFERVDMLRPKSTRKESKEIFFICKGFKGS